MQLKFFNFATFSSYILIQDIYTDTEMQLARPWPLFLYKILATIYLNSGAEKKALVPENTFWAIPKVGTEVGSFCPSNSAEVLHNEALGLNPGRSTFEAFRKIKSQPKASSLSSINMLSGLVSYSSKKTTNYPLRLNRLVKKKK